MIQFEEITFSTTYCPGVTVSISRKGLFFQSSPGMGAGRDIPAEAWPEFAVDVAQMIGQAEKLGIESVPTLGPIVPEMGTEEE